MPARESVPFYPFELIQDSLDIGSVIKRPIEFSSLHVVQIEPRSQRREQYISQIREVEAEQDEKNRSVETPFSIPRLNRIIQNVIGIK